MSETQESCSGLRTSWRQGLHATQWMVHWRGSTNVVLRMYWHFNERMCLLIWPGVVMSEIPVSLTVDTVQFLGYRFLISEEHQPRRTLGEWRQEGFDAIGLTISGSPRRSVVLKVWSVFLNQQHHYLKT